MSYHDTLIEEGLEPLLHEFRNLPVHDEPAVLNSGRTEARFGYQHWNSGISAPEFIKNESTWLTESTDYRANYEKGKIDMISSLVAGDEVTGTYRFKYFTDTDWTHFIDIALKEMNAKKPATSYTIESMPLDWDPFIIMRAYQLSLKRLMLDSILWSTRLIFADPAMMNTMVYNLYLQATDEVKGLITVKRRGEVAPKTVSSYKRSIPRKVTGINWRSYTLLGAYSIDT